MRLRWLSTIMVGGVLVACGDDGGTGGAGGTGGSPTTTSTGSPTTTTTGSPTTTTGTSTTTGMTTTSTGMGGEGGEGGEGGGAMWICDPTWYDEAPPFEYCDCECGLPDPDCSVPGAPLVGCVQGETCGANGTCELLAGEVCANLADDDADGLIDCDDQECFGQTDCPPMGWECPGFLYDQHPIDSTCECNCGIADPDCDDAGITTSDCPLNQACVNDVCADATGEDCDNGVNDDGDGQIDCADADCAGQGNCPPATWVCDPAWWDEQPPNEFCDCECGGVDPDCADPANEVFGCAPGEVCSDMGSCEIPTGEICDNGIDDDGGNDVDCDDSECLGAAGCAPVTWTCPPAWWDEDAPNEFCDCECGGLDPDCSSPANPVFGCSPAETCGAAGTCEPATGEVCDNGITDDADPLVDCNDPECFADASCMVPGTWTCDPNLFNEPFPGEVCDCDCGAPDPDCQVPGAPLYGCAAFEICDAAGACVPAPELCNNGADDDGDGDVDCDDSGCAADPSCPPPSWTCPDAYYDEDPPGEFCDCDCGAPDPDCATPGLPLAGCVAGETCNPGGNCVPALGEICDNGVNDDADTAVDCLDPECNGDPACGGGGWTCNPGFFGTNDGCDCGCGIVDPDCANATVGVCQFCGNVGSCNVGACPGTINATNNAVCN